LIGEERINQNLYLLADSIKKLVVHIKTLGSKIDSLNTLFLDNITFIRSMSNVGESISDLVVSLMKNYEESIAYKVKIVKESSEFFKYVESSRYKNTNILEEWFIDAFRDIIKEHDKSSSTRENSYYENWINLQIVDYYEERPELNNINIDYVEHVILLNTILCNSVKKFFSGKELSDVIDFVVKSSTLFMTFLSAYHLKPLREYPLYDLVVSARPSAGGVDEASEKLLNEVKGIVTGGVNE